LSELQRWQRRWARIVGQADGVGDWDQKTDTERPIELLPPAGYHSPMPNGEHPTWDLFIAHAGADKGSAEALYAHVHDRARTFLASKCLKPGDDWSVELPRAQQAARVTVVLVSSHTEGAYYQREEIAAAIDAARRRPKEHRVVPLYLDSTAIERTEIPYGLRIRQGIALESGDAWAHAADRLLDALATPLDPESGLAGASGMLHAGTAGFIGCTQRGPDGSPLSIESFQEFIASFGPPLDASVSFLGHAVRGFFENGGKRAYVARVLHASATTAGVRVPAADGEDCLIVRSRDRGVWGNRYVVDIEEGARVGLRLTVSVGDPSTGHTQLIEDYDNLSTDPNDTNYLPALVDAGSRHVFVGWTGAMNRAPSYGRWPLAGGSDGPRPAVTDYARLLSYSEEARSSWFGQDLDVSLLCVPDCVHPQFSQTERDALTDTVVACAEQEQDCLAIIPAGMSYSDPKAPRDSMYAALYAPWLSVRPSEGGGTILIPPCGHVCGAYARRDAECGVHAPLTDLPVAGLDALAAEVDDDRRLRLRKRGVNVLQMTGAGTAIVESGITMALDPRLQPVHLQRQVGFVRRALRRGTQWLVFEPNVADVRKRLVAQVREFLETLWRSGMLSGTQPSEAFFVRCDETTMTASDFDNGRVVCEIGFALADPPTTVRLTLALGEFGAGAAVRIS
jgi:hypothetical protein